VTSRTQESQYLWVKFNQLWYSPWWNWAKFGLTLTHRRLRMHCWQEERDKQEERKRKKDVERTEERLKQTKPERKHERKRSLKYILTETNQKMDPQANYIKHLTAVWESNKIPGGDASQGARSARKKKQFHVACCWTCCRHGHEAPGLNEISHTQQTRRGNARGERWGQTSLHLSNMLLLMLYQSLHQTATGTEDVDRLAIRYFFVSN
jgi:hypothetical protein